MTVGSEETFVEDDDWTVTTVDGRRQSLGAQRRGARTASGC
jgi:hypothetical protein